MRRLLSMTLLLALAAPAAAQEPTEPTPAPRGEAVPRPAQPSAPAEPQKAPRGPRDVMERVKQQRAEKEAQEREARQQPMGSPHDGADRAALRRAMGQGRALSTAKPSDEVPPGTIVVEVVDGDDQPVEGATVDVGIMASMGGGRRHVAAQTGSDGTATFSELEVGTSQSYRVSVPHKGASYGPEPFRLGHTRGHRVRITRLPVTQDSSVLLLALGHTELSLRNERLHVIQQYQLMNLGDATYVFPDEGQLIRLPEDFTGFQAQESMTDQQVSKTEEGLRIHGSVTPGAATLMWGFDLPLSGSEMSFTVGSPWKTFRYRVAARMAPGMSLELDGLPEPREHEHEGSEMLVSELQRRPNDPPFESARITVRGIPGPGPLRWVALGGLFVLGLAGVMMVIRPGRRSAAATSAAREQRKQELLDEAADIERMHAAGEIGPKYRQRRMDAVVTELASILRQQASVRKERRGPSASQKGRAKAS